MVKWLWNLRGAVVFIRVIKVRAGSEAHFWFDIFTHSEERMYIKFKVVCHVWQVLIIFIGCLNFIIFWLKKSRPKFLELFSISEYPRPKICEVKEYATCGVNLRFKDHNLMLYTYQCMAICIAICQLMGLFWDRLNLCSTAALNCQTGQKQRQISTCLIAQDTPQWLA